MAYLGDAIDPEEQAAGGSELYLHDKSIDVLCPALLDELRVPRFFRTDYQLQVPLYLRNRHSCPSKLKMSHPSLFLGGKGTQSGLHADSRGSRFWMALLSGKKRFRIFSPDQAELLYPTDTYRFYPTNFEVNAFEPDYERFPKLRQAVCFEAELGPGDIIFIPEGWPHAVINDEAIIATSYNFVDRHNLAHHLMYMRDRTKLGKNVPGPAAAADAREARTQVGWMLSPSFPQDAAILAKDDTSDETWHQFWARQASDPAQAHTIRELFRTELPTQAVLDMDTRDPALMAYYYKMGRKQALSEGDPAMAKFDKAYAQAFASNHATDL